MSDETVHPFREAICAFVETACEKLSHSQGSRRAAASLIGSFPANFVRWAKRQDVPNLETIIRLARQSGTKKEFLALAAQLFDIGPPDKKSTDQK